MLGNPKEMLNKARAEGYAVCSPSCWDDAQIKTVLKIAEERRSPVILSIHVGYPDPEYIKNRRIFQLAESVTVPVSINLDHGRKFEDAIWAINVGLPQMMVDRSYLPFEENIAQTKEIIKIAHAVNVFASGEVGRTGNKNDHGQLTDPEELKRFVKETGADAVAVSVGNLHGFSEAGQIDMERVKLLADAVSIPLEIHGGSGIPREDMTTMAKLGMSYFQMQNYLNLQGIKGMEIYLKEVGGLEKMLGYNLRKLMQAAWDGWAAELGNYMDALGSTGKA